MAEILRVSMPVRYVERSHETARLGTVEVAIPRAAPEEAPVVVEWQGKSFNAFRRPDLGRELAVRFRAFDGRLMVRLNEMRYFEPAKWSDVMPQSVRDGGKWHDLLENQHGKVVNHPFLPQDLTYGGTGATVRDLIEDEVPSVSERFLSAAARVRHRAEQALVIEDEVWVPTWGPLLLSRSDPEARGRGVVLQNLHPQEKYHRSNFDTALSTWSAFDLDGVHAAQAAVFGDVRVPDDAVEVLSKEGWSMDACIEARRDIAADRLVRGMLWSSRQRRLSTADASMLEGVELLRGLMEERWPEWAARAHISSWAMERPEGVVKSFSDEDVVKVGEALERLAPSAEGIVPQHWRAAWGVMGGRRMILEDLKGLAV